MADPPGDCAGRPPRIQGISANFSVLLVALGLSFLAVAAVSALPAVSLRDADLRLPRAADGTASGTPSRTFAWTGAIALQVTLAVVTLVASLLLVRTLYNLERLEPGFEQDGLGLAQSSCFPRTRQPWHGEQLVDQLVERVGALPGVQAVTRVDD